MNNSYIEFEALADIIQDYRKLDDYRDILHPEYFEHEVHQKIVEYIQLLGERVGKVSLKTAIENNSEWHLVGGQEYIDRLCSEYLSSSSDYLIKELRTACKGRELVKEALKVPGLVKEGNIDEIEKNFSNLFKSIIRGGYIKLSDALEEFIDYVEDKSKGKSSEIKCGIDKIDNFLGGMHPANLVIIGGRPKMGKTSLVLQIINNLAKNGIKSGFHSLEMSQNELISKLTSIDTNIPYQLIRNARLSESDFAKLARSYSSEHWDNILMDDTPGATIGEIKSKSRQMVRDGARLIAVDYLQLVEGRGKNDNDVSHFGNISRECKKLARELEIPFILLSQLNRGSEARSDTRPKASDFRGSGAIEQDADSAIFVHRPDNINTPEVCELIVGLNRHGETGIIDMCFQGAQGIFREWREGEKPEESRNKPKGK